MRIAKAKALYSMMNKEIRFFCSESEFLCESPKLKRCTPIPLALDGELLHCWHFRLQNMFYQMLYGDIHHF
jgi:hypothetical protein